MIVEMFTVGSLLTNCYVVVCEQTKDSIIIDPAFASPDEAESIFSFIQESNSRLKIAINTHGHPDHTCGNGIVKEKTHVPIMIHELDAHLLGKKGEKLTKEILGRIVHCPPPDAVLHDGQLVTFGKTALRVIHAPGHSRGGILLLGEKEVFTGDTLFAGSIGRTDYPGSSAEEMRASLRKLKALPDPLIVYPGHGPATTIGAEKSHNPFL